MYSTVARDDAVTNSESGLLDTPLRDFHLARGAKMVAFAGYDMPVQYPLGVMKEHLHTRAAAGLFDVSHMGQVVLMPRSGNVGDAALALERLVPVDIAGLDVGRQRYGMFTNPAGGILDDLMLANLGHALFVVVNAACKGADIAHMQAHLADECEIEVLSDRALLALQGPAAEAALASLSEDTAAMKFMDVIETQVAGVPAIVSRSGYSGEDGYEISVLAEHAVDLAEALVAHPAVEPIGLGARDSLRLEAGLCLYGSDMDENTTPVEASLNWAIQKVRRLGGARAGGFPGDDVILAQLGTATARKRVGILPEGRAPMRAGTVLFADEASAEPIGHVTSGGFGPSVGRPVSMGYVTAAHASPGTRIFADIRGKRMAADVAAMPFITPTYKR